MRWVMAEVAEGGVRVCPVDGAGRRAGAVEEYPSAAEGVGRSPDARWVWRASAELYPAVLAAGSRVQRCYDVEDAEALLLGCEGAGGTQPRSLPAAYARLHGLAVPDDAPARAADTQASLFDAGGPAPLPEGTDPLEALLEVYAAQLGRIQATPHPGRTTLLIAVQSAGWLIAAEMHRAGLPWRADIHDNLLTELLGGRYPGGLEPPRLAELAEEVSQAFGSRVRPDLAAEVRGAFAKAGIKLSSTRKWELQEVDHPAVAPLLEYKRLYRLHTAHGWSWLASWVRDGRFRPEYVPGGAMSGRWTTNGGGALQIPKVIRQAVIADPGWKLVVADAAQMEPRILAAVSRDPGLMRITADERDLYASLLPGSSRDEAKLALLGAMYGQTSGDALKHMADLRRRFPLAVAYVDEAARAGEEGRLVSTYLGRTCPPVAGAAGFLEEGGAQEEEATSYAPDSSARSRGRFTRNFVVQGAAADWAMCLLAALRQDLAEAAAELVFFQHDEVIVHCPEEEVPAVLEAIPAAAARAGEVAFGDMPVHFAFSTAVVDCYADAK